MDIKTNEDVLNYISCGIVDNKNQCHYKTFARMMYKFLVDCEEIDSEYQLEILKQTTYIIVKLFKHQNKELEVDYFKLRELILDSLEEDNQE